MTPLRYGLLSVASAALLAGTLWFQRSNPTVIQARDIVELRQAVIERCLATQYLPDNTNVSSFSYSVFVRIGDTTNTFAYGTPSGVRTGLLGRAEEVTTNMVWTNRYAGKLLFYPPLDPVVATHYEASNQMEMTYTEITLVPPDWWLPEYDEDYDWHDYADEIVTTNTRAGMVPMREVVLGDWIGPYSWGWRTNSGLEQVDRFLNSQGFYGNSYDASSNGNDEAWVRANYPLLWRYTTGLVGAYLSDAYPEAAGATTANWNFSLSIADVTNMFRHAGSTNIGIRFGYKWRRSAARPALQGFYAYFNDFQPPQDLSGQTNADNVYGALPLVSRLSHTNIATVTNLTIIFTNIISTNELTGIITNAGWVATNAAIVTTTNVVYRYPTLSTNMLSQRYKVLEKLKRTDVSDRAIWVTSNCASFALEGAQAYGYWTNGQYVGTWSNGQPDDTNSLPANTWTIDATVDASNGWEAACETLMSDHSWTRTYETGAPMISMSVAYVTNSIQDWYIVIPYEQFWLVADIHQKYYQFSVKIRQASPQLSFLSGHIPSRTDFWVRSRCLSQDILPLWISGPFYWIWFNATPPLQYCNYGLPIIDGAYKKGYQQSNFTSQTNVVFTNGFLPDPYPSAQLWSNDPKEYSTNVVTYEEVRGDEYQQGGGHIEHAYYFVQAYSATFVIDGQKAAALWNFQYCTNSL